MMGPQARKQAEIRSKPSIESRHRALEAATRPLGERRFVIGEVGDAGPGLLRRGAASAEDLVELVDLAITGPEGAAVHHLRENDSNAPHVDRAGILALAQEDLWGTVPEGDNLVRVGTDGDLKGARKPKVGNLQLALTVDQQVLRLQVAVHDAPGVADGHTLEELVHVGFDQRHTHAI